MHTPEWYGTIGIMNSAHMHRRGILDTLQRVAASLRYALRAFRLPRGPGRRLRQHDASGSTPRRVAGPTIEVGPRIA